MAVQPRHTDKFNALEPKKTLMQRPHKVNYFEIATIDFHVYAEGARLAWWRASPQKTENSDPETAAFSSTAI